MSHRVEFNARNRILVISFLGIVTEDAIVGGIAAVQDALRSNPAEATILDFSGIDQFAVSPVFFQNFLNTRRKLVAPDKPRIVVAPKAVVYGMMRMLQAHLEAENTAPKVVRTMAEAYELLNLAGPDSTSDSLSLPSTAGDTSQP